MSAKKTRSLSADGARRRPLIAMLTDFGSEGWYVGVMKAVIKCICPEADIIDISHKVTPQSVAEGAFMLAACHEFFPPGTIFLAVIDPGVGSAREPVLLKASKQWFAAPNNGLLGPVAQRDNKSQCRRLTNPQYYLGTPSATFHGRDIFAPAAAHLAAGVPWTQLAPEKTMCFGLPASEPSYDCGIIMGNIIYFDHFGNAITNISHKLFMESFNRKIPAHKRVSASRKAKSPSSGETGAPAIAIQAGEYVIPGISRAYSDVKFGEALACWGSAGYLEIAVNHGNARSQLGLILPGKVIIRRIGVINK